jgi:hypothetical protein
MKIEKMAVMSGRLYIEIRDELKNNGHYVYNMGTSAQPQMVNLTDIYLDTDPEFTRNPKQYAKIDHDKNVQVKLEYEE